MIVFVRLETPGQIRELYRERIALERDYAAKLLALAQKNVEKKNKKMARAVLGDEPYKQWNDETIHQRRGLYPHFFALRLTYVSAHWRTHTPRLSRRS